MEIQFWELHKYMFFETLETYFISLFLKKAKRENKISLVWGKMYMYIFHLFLGFTKRCVPTPGIEPGPAGWEPAILTPRPCRITVEADCLLSKIYLLFNLILFFKWQVKDRESPRTLKRKICKNLCELI